MEFIKLTSLQDKATIFINPAFIGHLYDVPEKYEYGRVERGAHAVVGTTCHNNGGFRVTESVEKILKMIKALK